MGCSSSSSHETIARILVLVPSIHLLVIMCAELHIWLWNEEER